MSLKEFLRDRDGLSRNTRPYHLYVLGPKGFDSLVIDGRKFVKYKKEYLDVRGGGGKSKAEIILDYLRKHKDQAFFSKDIADALKEIWN